MFLYLMVRSGWFADFVLRKSSITYIHQPLWQFPCSTFLCTISYFFSNSPSCVPNVTHSISSRLCLLRYSIVASLVLHCTSLLFPLLIYIIRIYHFLQVCLLRPCFHYLFLYCYNWCYFLWFNETLYPSMALFV